MLTVIGVVPVVVGDTRTGTQQELQQKFERGVDLFVPANGQKVIQFCLTEHGNASQNAALYLIGYNCARANIYNYY